MTLFSLRRIDADHLRDARRGRIERAAGFEQADDLSTAIARALDDLLEAPRSRSAA
jgi:hypothetical protein